ncbi:zinc finger protein 184-like [Ylistrum balloti]|uniref:zinc finger protein 184-like n=1 Tax=Ylistrum balloti TaxID=509963 RepID=UPI002905BAB1|nr:zinc finger protein 184-like [Ylistrum balloti]
MDIPDSSMYNENLQSRQTGFNGTYEPTDSIIIRTTEIHHQQLELCCKEESSGHDTKEYSLSSDFRLNQSYTEHFSERHDTPVDETKCSEIKQPTFMKDSFSDDQSDSVSFQVDKGLITKRSSCTQFSPSTSPSAAQKILESRSGSSRDIMKQNVFVTKERSTSGNTTLFGENDQPDTLDCDEVQNDASYEEGDSVMEDELFQSKRNLFDSQYIYRSETGEPSLISPCTTALTEQQDLDPSRYGPNGNLENRCEICGKTFSQPYLLKVHFRIHSGFKPYKCELCHKGFAQSSGLRSHKLTHTGEKPYRCDLCDKTFTASGSLNMHYRTHNGERPFPCEICGRTFRYRSAMNKHMMIHTGDRPYTCDDCGKDFSRKGNLETHRRIHTNSMPYQCDICEKKFNQMSNLRTHKVTHSLVKPYKCDLCGSEFFTKFNMQRHIVIQHIKNKQ